MRGGSMSHLEGDNSDTIREDAWRKTRYEYLRGLTQRTPEQYLLLTLVQAHGIRGHRLNDGETDLTAVQTQIERLWALEKANERHVKRLGQRAKQMSKEDKAARKARDHELYKAAGLLGLAGAVDKKTGKLKIDAGFLVGFLKVIIDSNPAIDGNGAKYKALGDSLIAQSQTKKKDKDPV